MASGVLGSHGSPVFDAWLCPWREARVVTCYVPGEQPALVVIPAELPYLLVWWKRGSGGLEGLAFIQLALGVQRRVPGRGFEGKFGLGAAVMGQVTGAPGIEACWVLWWLFGFLQGVGQRVEAVYIPFSAFPAFQEGQDGLHVLSQGLTEAYPGQEASGVVELQPWNLAVGKGALF